MASRLERDVRDRFAARSRDVQSLGARVAGDGRRGCPRRRAARRSARALRSTERAGVRSTGGITATTVTVYGRPRAANTRSWPGVTAGGERPAGSTGRRGVRVRRARDTRPRSSVFSPSSSTADVSRWPPRRPCSRRPWVWTSHRAPTASKRRSGRWPSDIPGHRNRSPRGSVRHRTPGGAASTCRSQRSNCATCDRPSAAGRSRSRRCRSLPLSCS
jgi:hypothetical protein